MGELIAVGVGGFIGSCLRYLITKGFHGYLILPIGTLVSNVVAGLLIGFIIGIDQQTALFSPRMKLFLTTGFLGGLSTFSTFSLETVNLLKESKYLYASANVMLNLCLSLLGVVIGLVVAHLLFKQTT